jgi:hypothetical protein
MELYFIEANSGRSVLGEGEQLIVPVAFPFIAEICVLFCSKHLAGCAIII